MTQYSFTKDEHNNIKFWTNNKEIADRVEQNIFDIIDAIRWRKSIERIDKIDEPKPIHFIYESEGEE